MVPSPQPRAILEIGVIDLLVREKVIVVCAGGGGIPVVANPGGDYEGVEAVIDKDLAGALLATSLHADAFLMLTDVDAVYADWGTPAARPVRRASPDEMASRHFAAGSMGPKVEAACRFVRANSGFAVDRVPRRCRSDAPRRGRDDGDPPGDADRVGDRAARRGGGGVGPGSGCVGLVERPGAIEGASRDA